MSCRMRCARPKKVGSSKNRAILPHPVYSNMINNRTLPGEGYIESLRKELTDSRRQLADSNIERDKYSTSNKELRDHVKRVESAKREQARAIEEALQKISNLEETRNTLENERTRLSTILKETENNFTKTTQVNFTHFKY